MKRLIRHTPAALLVLLAATEVSADCSAIRVGMEDKLKGLDASFQGIAKQREQELRDESEALKKDAPNVDRTDTKFGFNFDVNWKDREIILDLPDVTMKDQEMILRLPEVTVKQQKWIWDRPAVRMVRKKTGQYPEFICRNVTNMFGIPGIECYTKWSDLVADVPETYMERTETILGVPEFSFRDQRIVLGIPQFSMRRQTWILRLPEFVLKNVTVESEKLKKRADELQTKAKGELGSLIESHKVESEKLIVTEMNGVFTCEQNDLLEKRAAALSEFQKSLSVIEVSLAKAREVNSVDFIASLDKSRTDLLAARDKAMSQFDMGIAELAKQQQAAFKKDPLALSQPYLKSLPHIRFQ